MILSQFLCIQVQLRYRSLIRTLKHWMGSQKKSNVLVDCFQQYSVGRNLMWNSKFISFQLNKIKESEKLNISKFPQLMGF